jgi:hypothetical protein
MTSHALDDKVMPSQILKTHLAETYKTSQHVLAT